MFATMQSRERQGKAGKQRRMIWNYLIMDAGRLFICSHAVNANDPNKHLELGLHPNNEKNHWRTM